MDKKEKEIVDKDLKKMDDNMQDVKDFIERKTVEVEITEGSTPVDKIEDLKPETEKEIFEPEKIEEEVKEEVVEEVDEPKEETTEPEKIEEEVQAKSNDGIKRVSKKVSHKGRIFLIALSVPALAVGAAAVVWPTVKSCSGKTDPTPEPTPSLPETEIDPEMKDVVEISNKQMVGQNLVITLATTQTDKRVSGEKLNVTIGGVELREVDDYTFDIATQKLTILPAGLAKGSGKVSIDPGTLEYNIVIVGDDGEQVVGQVVYQEIDKKSGRLGIEIEMLDEGYEIHNIKKIIKGTQELIYEKEESKNNEYEFDYDDQRIIIEAGALQYPGKFVIQAHCKLVFQYGTQEGCNAKVDYWKPVGDDAMEVYISAEEGYFINNPQATKVYKGEGKDQTDVTSLCSFDKVDDQLKVNMDQQIFTSGPTKIIFSVDVKQAEILEYTPIGETKTCSVKAGAGFLSTAEITIPEKTMIDGTEYTVTEIEANGFAGKEYLESVTIPSTVTKIGVGAFAGCTKLIFSSNKKIAFEKDLCPWHTNYEGVDTIVPVISGGWNAYYLAELYVNCELTKYAPGEAPSPYLTVSDEVRSSSSFIQGERTEGKNEFTFKYIPADTNNEIRLNFSNDTAENMKVLGKEKYLSEGCGVKVFGDSFLIDDPANIAMYTITINFDDETIKAERVVSENLNFTKIESEEVNCSVAGPSFTSDWLDIPQTAVVGEDTLKVTQIVDKAFNANTNINKALIRSNVEKIGAKAFADCTNLTSLRFENEMIPWRYEGEYNILSVQNSSLNAQNFTTGDPSGRVLIKYTDVPNLYFRKLGEADYVSMTKTEGKNEFKMFVPAEWGTQYGNFEIHLNNDGNTKISPRDKYLDKNSADIVNGEFAIHNYDHTKSYEITVDLDNQIISTKEFAYSEEIINIDAESGNWIKTYEDGLTPGLYKFTFDDVTKKTIHAIQFAPDGEGINPMPLADAINTNTIRVYLNGSELSKSENQWSIDSTTIHISYDLEQIGKLEIYCEVTGGTVKHVFSWW